MNEVCSSSEGSLAFYLPLGCFFCLEASNLDHRFTTAIQGSSLNITSAWSRLALPNPGYPHARKVKHDTELEGRAAGKCESKTTRSPRRPFLRQSVSCFFLISALPRLFF
jgi:hypothetical protein